MATMIKKIIKPNKEFSPKDTIDIKTIGNIKIIKPKRNPVLEIIIIVFFSFLRFI